MCARLKLARCIHDLTSLLSNKKLLSAVTRCQSSSERTENDNISRLLKKQDKKKRPKKTPQNPRNKPPNATKKTQPAHKTQNKNPAFLL